MIFFAYFNFSSKKTKLHRSSHNPRPMQSVIIGDRPIPVGKQNTVPCCQKYTPTD